MMSPDKHRSTHSSQNFLFVRLSKGRWRELGDILGVSKRESEVIELLMQGLKEFAVATALRIKQNTVRAHVRNIYNKLGVNSRLELAERIFDELAQDGQFDV